MQSACGEAFSPFGREIIFLRAPSGSKIGILTWIIPTTIEIMHAAVAGLRPPGQVIRAEAATTSAADTPTTAAVIIITDLPTRSHPMLRPQLAKLTTAFLTTAILAALATLHALL